MAQIVCSHRRNHRVVAFFFSIPVFRSYRNKWILLNAEEEYSTAKIEDNARCVSTTVCVCVGLIVVRVTRMAPLWTFEQNIPSACKVWNRLRSLYRKASNQPWAPVRQTTSRTCVAYYIVCTHTQTHTLTKTMPRKRMNGIWRPDAFTERSEKSATLETKPKWHKHVFSRQFYVPCAVCVLYGADRLHNCSDRMGRRRKRRAFVCRNRFSFALFVVSKRKSRMQ